MKSTYVYLLGLYLGDGTIVSNGRTYQLRLCLDARYPTILDSAERALAQLVPHGRVHRRARRGSWVLESGWIGWPKLFPQHGPGKKHTRRIALGGWQRALVEQHPKELVRGLIHSDGCRTSNRFAVTLPSGRRAEYAYARSFFSNRSDDIRALFTQACDRLGVRWTQSNERNISIASRRGVELLDAFVGRKE